MAIVRNIEITVKGNTATLSEDIYVYLGDGRITFLFTILEPHYVFGSFRPDNLNVVEESDAQWARVCVLKPDGSIAMSDHNEVLDGKIKFDLTLGFINDIGEEGTHQLQIHLYDDQYAFGSNRLTIPPVPIHVLKPICDSELHYDDHDND